MTDTKSRNASHMIYSSWDIECDRLKLVIIGHSFLFYPPPPKNPKIKNLKKWQKLLEISSVYTGVPKTTIIWRTFPEIRSETESFVIMGHFLPFFPPSTPLTTPKIKILKKWKQLEISSFHTRVPKIMIICYTVPEIWCVTDTITIFHFGLFFALLPP